MNYKKMNQDEAHGFGCSPGGKTVPDSSNRKATVPDEGMYGKMDAGIYVDLMSDAGFKAAFADKNNKMLLVRLLNNMPPAGMLGLKVSVPGVQNFVTPGTSAFYK